MLNPIDFSTAKCIVEFGPGTGVFTEKILEKMLPDGILLVFEINTIFCEELKKIKDERLIVIEDSAEKIGEYIKNYGFDKADYVISSLPFAMIPDEIVNSILNNSNKFLSEKGKFIQFQYSQNALSKLKLIFPRIETEFTLLNIPPAFVFSCYK